MKVLCYNNLYLLEHIASRHMIVFRLYHNKRVTIKAHMISFSLPFISPLCGHKNTDLYKDTDQTQKPICGNIFLFQLFDLFPTTYDYRVPPPSLLLSRPY